MKSQQKSIRIVVLPLLVFLAVTIMQAQTGVIVEVGVGHNQLFVSTSPSNVPSGTKSSLTRSDWLIVPMIRVSYRHTIQEDVVLNPFLAYNRYGGSYKQSDGYEDQIWLDAVECGLTSSYLIGPIGVGVGAKVGYVVKANGEWHLPSSGTSPASTDKAEVTSWYKRWWPSAGLRVNYDMLPMSFALEGWFGFAQSGDGFRSLATDRQNHIRAILGYMF